MGMVYRGRVVAKEGHLKSPDLSLMLTNTHLSLLDVFPSYLIVSYHTLLKPSREWRKPAMPAFPAKLIAH